jgi:hypothetical protein
MDGIRTPMTKEVVDTRIRKWLTALRSGDYTQGTGVLRNKDNCFCCLGVAIDIFNKDTGFGEWQVNEHHGGADYRYATPLLPEQIGEGHEEVFQYNSGSLSTVVREYYDLGDHGLSANYKGDEASLINMNDFEGKSFLEIADIIEKTFLKE